MSRHLWHGQVCLTFTYSVQVDLQTGDQSITPAETVWCQEQVQVITSVISYFLCGCVWFCTVYMWFRITLLVLYVGNISSDVFYFLFFHFLSAKMEIHFMTLCCWLCTTKDGLTWQSCMYKRSPCQCLYVPLMSWLPSYFDTSLSRKRLGSPPSIKETCAELGLPLRLFVLQNIISGSFIIALLEIMLCFDYGLISFCLIATSKSVDFLHWLINETSAWGSVAAWSDRLSL